MNLSPTSNAGASHAGPAKRLVVDANILIRAVFGLRVHTLIAQHCDTTAFYVPEANFEEACHYVAELAPKRGFAKADWKAALGTIVTMIQIVPNEELVATEAAARARIARRDPADWPAVAAALVLDCPIWTEDADFFGAGIATWTTETVGIYLAEPH